MKRQIFIVIAMIFVFSCKNEFTVQRKNNQSDKREAEKVMDKYFDNLLLDKENENLVLYSEEFFKKGTKEQMAEQEKLIKNKLGKVLGKELKHWETSVVSGTSPKSEYAFIYEIQREKHSSLETFYLIKEESDSIKIHTHNIESEGLLLSE